MVVVAEQLACSFRWEMAPGLVLVEMAALVGVWGWNTGTWALCKLMPLCTRLWSLSLSACCNQ